MLEKRRAKIVKGASLILLVMGLSLVYFLSFNTGLTLASDAGNSNQVVVGNDSAHLIRDVELFAIQGGVSVPIKKITQLVPGETISIPLLPEWKTDGGYFFKVTAPYHLSQQLGIQPQSNNTIPMVEFSFQYPSIVDVGVSSIFSLESCSKENVPVSLSAEMVFEDDSVLSDPVTGEWVLSPLECATIPLEFVPISGGENLSFKIRVSTPSELLVEREQVITILFDAEQQLANPPILSGDMNSTITENV